MIDKYAEEFYSFYLQCDDCHVAVGRLAIRSVAKILKGLVPVL